jgi:hypothetical protein
MCGASILESLRSTIYLLLAVRTSVARTAYVVWCKAYIKKRVGEGLGSSGSVSCFMGVVAGGITCHLIVIECLAHWILACRRSSWCRVWVCLLPRMWRGVRA